MWQKPDGLRLSIRVVSAYCSLEVVLLVALVLLIVRRSSLLCLVFVRRPALSCAWLLVFRVKCGRLVQLTDFETSAIDARPPSPEDVRFSKELV